MDYQKLVDEVIGRLWAGKPAKPYMDLVNRVPYVRGACETLNTLKARGLKLGIVSSGPSDLAERAERECGVGYHFTNKILIQDGKVVGSRDIAYWPIRYGSKRDPLREICRMSGVSLEETVVVGHEDNDIEMAEDAGFAIAFYPTSDALVKHCDVVVNGGAPDLRKILPHVG